jgi:hypothetical protein
MSMAEPSEDVHRSRPLESLQPSGGVPVVDHDDRRRLADLHVELAGPSVLRPRMPISRGLR